MTQSERLAALEQRLSDHEARCEERLGELKATAASTLAAVEGLKNRTWGVAAALLAWALAQIWATNVGRLDQLEAAKPATVRPLEARLPTVGPALRIIHMATKLTAHFALEELACAPHREIDNRPPPDIVVNLRRTAARMEEVRRVLGDRAITVTCGYRSPALNLAMGGARTSAHLAGQAVDFNCLGFGDAKAVCRAVAESPLAFDQLIEEGAWVHISFDPRMRRQVLTKRPQGGYALGLNDGRDLT